MKKFTGLSLGILLLAVSAAFAGENTHWGYSGHEGPEHWGTLDLKYSMCSDGKNQSPINLSSFIEAELVPIQFNYTLQTKEILNNGHTVQVNYSQGSSVMVNGKGFQLVQFHFHAPSENQINGKSFCLEAQFVDAVKNGNLVVAAVMY